MLDLKAVVDDLDGVRAALARRGPAHAEALGPVAALAARRSEVIQKLEALRKQKNEANEAMAKLDKGSDEFTARRASLKEIAQQSKALEAESRQVEARLGEALMSIPNLPAPNVPDGHDESSNVQLRSWGEKPGLGDGAKDHIELGTALGILDFERAAKLSGSRFVVLKGAGARLERALLSFMLDLHGDAHGYTEVWPPALVLDSAMRGTGQLPKFAGDSFRIAADWEGDEDAEDGQTERRNLYLIPTAEVPVTNLHADEIIEAGELPIRYCAYTPCFRSEAGSHGRDTRGMIRQHQFDKVELVRFEHPDRAEAAHEELTAHAEAVMQKLGLHYRVVELCAGDLGFAAKRCFDLEVWLPGQQAYREISSCSWFGDFQARRARIRFRPEATEGGKGKNKPQMLHTLNGSGLAIGRCLIAILEQYQQPDGSVRVPEALQPYMGGMQVIS
jgi:seryl-tRNA synthetase